MDIFTVFTLLVTSFVSVTCSQILNTDGQMVQKLLTNHMLQVITDMLDIAGLNSGFVAAIHDGPMVEDEKARKRGQEDPSEIQQE